MLTIVLYQPQIAPNTGNIMRLCANTGAQLVLIKPYGFVLSDKKLRRAGLDYREFAHVQEYDDFFSAHKALSHIDAAQTWWLFTTRGQGVPSAQTYGANDVLVFGAETHGVSEAIHAHFDPAHKLCLPMCPESRSLNLSNSVAIALYTAWASIGYPGAAS